MDDTRFTWSDLAIACIVAALVLVALQMGK
jgi:hypothetical protein